MYERQLNILIVMLYGDDKLRNIQGAVSGMAAGASIMSLMAYKALKLQKSHSFQEKLPFSVESCPSDWIFNVTGTASAFLDSNSTAIEKEPV